MDKNATLYNFTQQMQGQIFFAAFKTNLSADVQAEWQNRPPLMNLKRGYAESPAWVLVQALEFAPDPLTVERFRKRAVYSSPSLTQALLEIMASEQLFDRIGDTYHLTDKGQAEADKITSQRLVAFEGFEPIPHEQIAELEKYLSQIIEASLQADISTWCLEHSHNRAPASDAPLLAKIIQYGSDLNAFRDDAHMTAFGEYDVLGHVWEAFSYIKSEQANKASELYEKLSYRGFYTEDWQSALDDLVTRGWITEDDTYYRVTEEGIKIAEDVEQKTNHYFYAPWDVLSDDDYQKLIDLMQAISQAYRDLIAQPTA